MEISKDQIIFSDGDELDHVMNDRYFRVIKEKDKLILRYYSSEKYCKVTKKVRKELEAKTTDKIGNIDLAFNYCALDHDDDEYDENEKEIVPQVHILTFEVMTIEDEYGQPYISKWIINLNPEKLSIIINKLDMMVKQIP